MTDAFDHMFPRRQPMSADEAEAVICEMQRNTSKRSAVRLLSLAMGPAGNLTEEARAVYHAELNRLAQ